ncbi:MAG: hypothetical protein GY798_01755, partial [Hyphomicrobiales bacterium]|nr:hypothetical protein [Hyphomicrobiales bacterium]
MTEPPTQATWESIFRNHLLPAFAGSKLRHIRPSDIESLGVRHLASFAFGRRIAFLLPTGIGADGDRVFEIMGDPRRHSYTGGLPWFTNQHSGSLGTVWQGFSDRWA